MYQFTPLPTSEEFCQCWFHRAQVAGNACICEEKTQVEWKWQQLEEGSGSLVVMSKDQRTFDPDLTGSDSPLINGTVAVRGDTPLDRNRQHYWEVKIISGTYCADIMVGVGSEKVSQLIRRDKNVSLLGEDAESYGISYKGPIRHDNRTARWSVGFCRDSVIGVRLDYWRGMLQFYVNRIPQDLPFFDLRRHEKLFPMLCSTAPFCTIRLLSAESWQASLLVDALKILADPIRNGIIKLPPGMRDLLKNQFWLTLPVNDSDLVNEIEKKTRTEPYFPRGTRRTHAALEVQSELKDIYTY